MKGGISVAFLYLTIQWYIQLIHMNESLTHFYVLTCFSNRWLVYTFRLLNSLYSEKTISHAVNYE